MKAIVDQAARTGRGGRAGLPSGDEIIALDGKKIYTPLAIFSAEDAMSNSPAQPLALTVRRGNKEFDKTLTPVKPIQPTNSSPSLGILVWGQETNAMLVHPSPLEQIQS